MKRMSLVLLAMAVVGWIIGSAGCQSQPSGEIENRAAAGPAAAPASAPTASEVEPLRPGQAFVHEGLEITLLSLTRVSEFTKTPPEGQGYIVLRFKLRNAGAEEKSASVGGNLQWKEPSSDRRHGSESYTGVDTITPESYDLAPGATGEYEEVYAVPQELIQLEFHYVPGLDPKEKARWMLPIR